MEIRLRGAGLWPTVVEPPPQAPDAAFTQRSSSALQDLYSSCEPDQQYLILDFTAPKEIWDFFKAKYENRTPVNINRLWNEFDAIKMHDDEKNG